MEQGQKPMGMEENLAVVMMRVRRSVRTALREAVREEGLTQNEIEVLLFLQRGRFDTARDISRVRGMPRSLVSKAVDQLVKRGYVAARQDKRDRRVVRLELLQNGLGNRVVAMKGEQIVDFDITEALNMPRTFDEKMYRVSAVLSI